MLIEIRPDIFKSTEFWSSLKLILAICMDEGRHKVYVEIHDIINEPLFQKLDKDERDILQDVYSQIVEDASPPTIKCRVSESQVDAFSLKEAKIFLNQKFLIVLENNDRDGDFVDAMLNHFEEGAEIKRHYENAWLKYEMGGGSTISQAINAQMKTYKALPKDNHVYLRCFVLIDSDKQYPGDTPKEEQIKLIEFLEEFNIPYHILEKRQMENYLPIEAYDDIGGNTDYIAAYKRLSDTHKDHFDIKSGFKKSFSELSTELQTFYHGIPNGDKTIFETKVMGLGGSFKAEFPKLFQSDKVNRDSLLRRCAHQNNPNELPNILTKITELL